MRPSPASASAPRQVGRYALYGEIASGGMASVYFGRLLGEAGFSRTVAVKRLHPQFARDPEFVSMFLNEARLAARIRHPNVVSTLDIVSTEDELSLVMEYIQGESLAKLMRAVRTRGERIPPQIACAIVANALHGLHAAHEATTERGEPLRIVHRDVSPQNILVGIDGVARVLDFGVAKAAVSASSTREGTLKGKLAYMAPEQIRGTVDRRTDVYAASVVLWETLTGRRLFTGDSEGEIYHKVLHEDSPGPATVIGDLPPELDSIVVCGLSRDKERRFATARDMALALEACAFAAPSEVAGWAEAVAGELLARRARQIAEIESTSSLESTATVIHAPPAAPSGLTLRSHGAGVVSGAGSGTRLVPPPPGVRESGESQISALSSMATSNPTDLPPNQTVDAHARWMWIAVAVLSVLTVMGGLTLAFVLGSRSRGPGPSTAATAPPADPPAQTAAAPPPAAESLPESAPTSTAPALALAPSASSAPPSARATARAPAVRPPAAGTRKGSELEGLIDTRK